MFNVEYFPETNEDIALLPLEILAEVRDYFKKYEIDPYKYGKRLYDYKNTKLNGCYATYVANATYRIVYTVEDNVAKIVSIVAVGEREAKEVYSNAHNRLNKN